MRPKTIMLAFVMGATLLAAAPAWADGYVSPFIGDNAGGDAGQCPSATSCSSAHFTYGGVAGFMGAGILGLEEDVSFSPKFFGSVPSYGDNSLFTAMTNVVVGAPLGPIRPYVSGGAGVMHTHINTAPGGLTTSDTTNLGYDVGGGLMAFMIPHVGLRADYHYLRSTQDMTILGFVVNNSQLHYSRATAGVVFRF